jgi:hypothetical protein
MKRKHHPAPTNPYHGPVPDDDRVEGRRLGRLPAADKVGRLTAIPDRHDHGPTPTATKAPR